MVRPVKSVRPAAETSPPEVSRLGDGTWVQPTHSDPESLIVSPDVTIDPQVLRNMLRNRRSTSNEAETTPLKPVMKYSKSEPRSSVLNGMGIATTVKTEPRRTGVDATESVTAKKVTRPTTLNTTQNVTTMRESNSAVVNATENLAVKEGAQQTVTGTLQTKPTGTNGTASVPNKKEAKQTVAKTSEADPIGTEPRPTVSSTVDAVLEPDSTGAEGSNGDCGDTSTNYFAMSQGVQSETAALGRDLYLRFLHEEMRTVHVREPPCMDPWRAARLDLNYSQSLNASVRIRQSLRQVADVFSRSELREQVRKRAADVDIETLDFAAFQDLLFTLFQEGGLTSERIVVLFFFCADLTIRALTEQLTGCFHQLIEWSQLYIVGAVSSWVDQNGGWSAVLDGSTGYLYTAAKVGLVVASVAALCVLLRNKTR